MTKGDRQTLQKLQKTKIGKMFLDKRFLHYSWIGIFISILNIFLLWFFIDVCEISTIVSSIIVIGSTFVIRYVLYIYSEML